MTIWCILRIPPTRCPIDESNVKWFFTSFWIRKEGVVECQSWHINMKSSKPFTLLICMSPDYLTSILNPTFESWLVFALYNNWPSANQLQSNIQPPNIQCLDNDVVMDRNMNEYVNKFSVTPFCKYYGYSFTK